jgi:ceramide glucosyltransferase
LSPERNLMALAAVLLLVVVAGALVYCVLVIVAARGYLAVRPPALARAEPVSILKPLHGLDEGFEENLRSWFLQEYPDFELLCAVRDPDDPAAAVFEKLRQQFPHIPARLLVTGEPPYANAKVFSLDRMLAAARHSLLVMSDSDTRAAPDLVATVAAEFQDPRLGVATCPYRAAPGRSFWSRLEALMMNTEFLAGLLVARLIEGVKFAVGPCVAARREALAKIGGFDRLKDYLAEDFVMGALAAEAGYEVILSSAVIEHRIGSQPFRRNFEHRLRWVRSTRRSRPWGYLGQLFTYPLPPALALVALAPAWWPVLAGAAVLRAYAAWATAGWVLHDPLFARCWWLIPLQDVVSFLLWVAGFFGHTVTWRGRRYRLLPDGRFEGVAAPSETR